MSEDLVFDVVIVGGGIVGLSFANALAGSYFSVAVIERNELKAITEEPDVRVSAINRSALKHFQQTGVLDSPLAQRLCAFEKMFVWDQTGAGQIEFDSEELGVSELGVIVENNVLQQMLLESLRSANNITYLCPEEISEIDYQVNDDKEHVVSRLILSSGKTVNAKLLVGADGVNSKVREVAQIERAKQSYQ